ncbi:MAG: polysaccharide deacetylase family protein [Candidatus Wenzhouxiangella sp. M2_3B_020]
MGGRFVILAWHSIHVHDNAYDGNDLVAFSEDLERLDELGWTILPLSEARAGLDSGRLPDRTAVLTMDDGSIMDFHAFDHPTCGRQVSVHERLRCFAAALPAGARHVPHVSTFVIASPEARAELDRNVTLDLGVWPEDWWRAANESGLMAVESHSWDHNHDSLARTLQRDNRRGHFGFIDTEAECRGEVDAASDYIERVGGRRPRYFAYPYGQSSAFLREEYLPGRGPELGLEAALGCDPEPVTPASDRWNLPRFVCRRDWSTPDEFAALLRSVAG